MVIGVTNNFSPSKTKSAAFSALSSNDMARLGNYVKYGFAPGFVEDPLRLKTVMKKIDTTQEAQGFIAKTKQLFDGLKKESQLERVKELHEMAGLNIIA